ncbi:CCAAT-box DNA binding protein subunit B, putative [Plasmodium vinckei vinckei]|uniref:CCAAT-box DNA binding protein subunit B, putative n=1 Tax=Plasmodium vinckei vinckei TaxID=54757 RepID=A0A449BT36_PLAVN|nr:CCAAT-box DNA binding protein subunit B, putative [Plasmodium vinckei vinckei]VEV56637.1 CCAAT-box DNA binding protein subunit B, putative [Plasmodium vinckei vinckei]
MVNSMSSDKSENIDKTDMDNNANDRALNYGNTTNTNVNNNEDIDDICENVLINDKTNVETNNSVASNNDIRIKNVSTCVNENDQHDESDYINCDNDGLENKDMQVIANNENNSLEFDDVVIKNVECLNNFNNEGVEKSNNLEGNLIQENVIHSTASSSGSNKSWERKETGGMENIYSDIVDNLDKDELNYKEINSIKMDSSDFNKREQHDEKDGSISPMKGNNNSDKNYDLNNDSHECNMEIWNKSNCEGSEEIINYENVKNLEMNELDKDVDNCDEKKEKDISENCYNNESSNNDGNNLNSVCTNGIDNFDLNNASIETDMDKVKETEEEKNKLNNNENIIFTKNNSNDKDDNVLDVFKENKNNIEQNNDIASENNLETDTNLNECNEVDKKENDENDINNVNNNTNEKEERAIKNDENGCEKSNMENDNNEDINKKRKHISSYDESRKDRKLSDQKEYEEVKNGHINKYADGIGSNTINVVPCESNNMNIPKYVNTIGEIIYRNNTNIDSKNNSNSSAINLKIENDEAIRGNSTNAAYFSGIQIRNGEQNYNYNNFILQQNNKEEKNGENNLEILKEYDEKSRDNDDEYEDEQNENMSDNNYSDDEKINLDNCNMNDKKKNKNDSETLLPIANISRIMKRILPAKAKVAKESKDIIREYVTEFIQFLTSEASDRCLNEKRKTINGEDILFSMEKLGFNDYVEPLSEYLNKWKQMKGLSSSNRYYDKKFDISRNSQDQNMLINYNKNIFNNMSNDNYYAKENYGYNEGNCTANNFYRSEKNEFCNNNFSNTYFNNNGKNNINRI